MSKMNDLAIEFAEDLMENKKKIIQNLNSNDYKKSFDIIEGNFSKAIEFENYNERLNNKIKQLLTDGI